MKIGVGISGASGIILGLKLVQALAKHGHQVYLVVSKDACLTAVYELGREFSRPQAFLEMINQSCRSCVHLYSHNDFTAPIASGSFRLDATIIAPCSMATLAAAAVGLSDTLMRRMIDVAFKEKWKVIFVPRETPLSTIHLKNMLELAHLGAVMISPVPTWYVPMKTLDEVEDAIVGKILQQIGIEDDTLLRPWKCDYQQRFEVTHEE